MTFADWICKACKYVVIDEPIPPPGMQLECPRCGEVMEIRK